MKVATFKFVVTRRVMPMFGVGWTWTLWLGDRALCKAEHAWDTAASARRDARKFRDLLGLDSAEIETK